HYAGWPKVTNAVIEALKSKLQPQAHLRDLADKARFDIDHKVPPGEIHQGIDMYTHEQTGRNVTRQLQLGSGTLTPNLGVRVVIDPTTIKLKGAKTTRAQACTDIDFVPRAIAVRSVAIIARKVQVLAEKAAAGPGEAKQTEARSTTV